MRFASSLIALAFVVGCASTPEPDPLPPDSTDSGGYNDGSLSGSGVDGRLGGGASTDGTDQGAGDAISMPSETVIYFAFDSAVIDAAGEQTVNQHAEYLRTYPQKRLRLGGHTDERGTREYNIALGERRAETVRRALLLRGVPRAQINVVSYGEEAPAVFSSNESAWAQNRRVEFNYLR